MAGILAGDRIGSNLKLRQNTSKSLSAGKQKEYNPYRAKTMRIISQLRAKRTTLVARVDANVDLEAENDVDEVDNAHVNGAFGVQIGNLGIQINNLEPSKFVAV